MMNIKLIFPIYKYITRNVWFSELFNKLKKNKIEF